MLSEKEKALLRTCARPARLYGEFIRFPIWTSPCLVCRSNMSTFSWWSLPVYCDLNAALTLKPYNTPLA